MKTPHFCLVAIHPRQYSVMPADTDQRSCKHDNYYSETPHVHIALPGPPTGF